MSLYLSLSALHVSDSLVYHQERRFLKLYIAIGICRYHTYGTKRTGLYQLRYTASKNVARDDGLRSPKHVEHLMINKDSL